MQAGKIWLKLQKALHLISEQKYRQKKVKYLPHVNKTELGNQIANFQSVGIVKSKRNPRIIVSLTSFPERMDEIHYTIYSLLNQSLKPDMIVLWLAKEQFPNLEKDIPESVLKLKNNGLSIKWTHDTRPYKKLVPSLKEYPEDIIITTDDDIYYPPTWLELLYTAYLQNPKAIHCHRGHKIKFDNKNNILPYKKWKHRIGHDFASFKNFFTGAGGVLYPPHSLYKDVTDEKLFLKLSPDADDIWFWAMAVIAGTPINIVKNNHKQLIYVNPERELKLTDELVLTRSNTAGGDNDRKIQQVISSYPQIMDRLK